MIDIDQPSDRSKIRGQCRVGGSISSASSWCKTAELSTRPPAGPMGKHFVAELKLSLPIDAPAWLAVRTPPPPVEGRAELQEPVAENEFGGKLFSHTSPIYVTLAGQGVFDAGDGRGAWSPK